MMSKIDDTIAAYLAGFVDGEGTMTITRYNRKDRSGYVRYSLQFAVYNTNLAVLTHIQNHFGGTLTVVNRQPNNRKPQGKLSWPEKKMVSVIQAILPFLVIKREQAEILLAVQKTKLNATSGRKLGVSENVLNFRDAAIARIRILNRRGPENAIKNAKTG